MTDARLDESPARALLAAFYCLFAAVIAAGLCYFRHYLGGPGAAIFLIYWLEFVILATAIALRGPRYLPCFMAALVSLLALGVLPSSSFYVVGPLGAAALLALAARMKSQRCSPAVLAAGAMAAIMLGGIYFLTINGLGVSNLLLPERVLAGSAYPDTLFHTALSSVLSNYGELASPLNGLVHIRYHAFSHLWFGLAAKGVGLNSVHGYYLGLQIIALPLLLLGLSIATAAFSRARQNTASLIAVPLAILFLFDGIDWMSYLTSESHMVGLGLLLIGIPYLRTLADGQNGSPDRMAVLALIFAIFLTAAKISVGMTWTVAVVFLLLRQRRLSAQGWLASSALLILQAYVAVKFVIPTDNVATTSFVPLHFLYTYPSVAAVNFAVVCLAAAFHMRDWRTDTDRLWHATILLMLLVNMLPTLFLRVEGGSAYYFINVAAWISIASLSARLPVVAGSLPSRVVLAGCVVLIVAMTILTPQKLHAYGSLKYHRNALYGWLDPHDTGQAARANLFNADALTAVKAKSEASIGGRIAILLRNNGVTPGSDFLVAVSPTFDAFWTLTPQCNAAPFLIPAYFGVPLLDGLPPGAERCELGSYYGYRLYGREAQSRQLGDADLCKQTAAKGFHHTLILESVARARRLDCPVQRRAL